MGGASGTAREENRSIMAEEKKQGGCPSGKSCSECGGACAQDEQRLHENLSRIKHIILVMSGKGGVGKSTVAVNLATSLALEGYGTGIMDVDFHGPSVPKMLQLEGEQLMGEGEWILPVEKGALKVMSIGFTLPSPDHAVIWRGALKYNVIRQFLAEVKWGDLDYLVIDAPPGTGDEPLTVCQMLPQADGAVVVTTPQQVAASDVSKSLDFLRQLNFPVLGIVENMSGFACPHCGEVTEIFSSGAGEQLASQYGVPFLGKIPIDPAICQCGDSGKPFAYSIAKTATGKAFAEIVARLGGQ